MSLDRVVTPPPPVNPTAGEVCVCVCVCVCEVNSSCIRGSCNFLPKLNLLLSFCIIQIHTELIKQEILIPGGGGELFPRGAPCKTFWVFPPTDGNPSAVTSLVRKPPIRANGRG